MKANRRNLTDETAVSPVIGVMLMIVVTVILAAAVTSFSSGIQQKDKPTQATFDITCSASEGNITFRHMGGDIIYKEDIKIEVSHGLPKMTGYLPKGNLTFYPAESGIRDAGMDKIALQPGQVAKYHFDQHDITYQSPNGSDVTIYGPVLGEQVVEIGETFELSIIDVNTENTVYQGKVVMAP